MTKTNKAKPLSFLQLKELDAYLMKRLEADIKESSIPVLAEKCSKDLGFKVSESQLRAFIKNNTEHTIQDFTHFESKMGKHYKLLTELEKRLEDVENERDTRDGSFIKQLENVYRRLHDLEQRIKAVEELLTSSV
jgi:hypothetical protein